MTEKKLTFAGSTIGEPWWTIGEIVARALKPHGFEVTIVHESYGAHNLRWLTSRKADVGATTGVHLAAALESKGEFAGEKHGDFCAIAAIKRPGWLAFGVRHETAIGSLRDVKARQYPLRIMASSPRKGGELDIVLRHYDLSLEEITSWGGRYYGWLGRSESPYVREGLIDAMLGNTYLGYTPHNRYWYEATMLYNMRFLDFDEVLIEKLCRECGYIRSTLPHGLLRGLERDIPTVGSDSIYIYCRNDMDDDVAKLIAQALDEQSELFKHTRSVLYYEREHVADNPYIPLHRSVSSYYQSKGYIKPMPGGTGQG